MVCFDNRLWRHLRSYIVLACAALVATVFTAPSAQANVISATECAVSSLLCPAGSILAQVRRDDGIGPLSSGQIDFLNPTISSFDFVVGLPDLTFQLAPLATFFGQDLSPMLSQGLNGQATARAGANSGREFWLNVESSQNFFINSAYMAGFSAEARTVITGNCDPVAIAAGSSVTSRSTVGGVVLSPVGYAGDCAATPSGPFFTRFAFVGFIPTIGKYSTATLAMTTTLQFDFKPDSVTSQTISSEGFAVVDSPEPGTWIMLISATLLCFLWKMRTSFSFAGQASRKHP